LSCNEKGHNFRYRCTASTHCPFGAGEVVRRTPVSRQAAGVWLSGLIIDRIGRPPVFIAAGAALLVVGLTLRCCSTAAGGQLSAGGSARAAQELIDLGAVSTWLARHRAMAGEVSAAQFGNGETATMTVKSVNDLFMDELQDIYHAEKQLVKALPKMAKKAKSDQLRQAVEHHLEETKGQVQRLEQVFETLDAKPRAKKCEAMEGLIEEAEELMGEIATPEVLDAAMIGAAQKVEHYEIASYGTLSTLAQELGHTEAARLLEQTLSEEKAADKKLNEIALSGVNKRALQAAA
jgi:ferritin-like metal-binding protein YciE